MAYCLFFDIGVRLGFGVSNFEESQSRRRGRHCPKIRGHQTVDDGDQKFLGLIVFFRFVELGEDFGEAIWIFGQRREKGIEKCRLRLILVFRRWRRRWKATKFWVGTAECDDDEEHNECSSFFWVFSRREKREFGLKREREGCGQ